MHERAGITQDPERRLGTGQTDVHTADVRHETDTTCRTGSDAREDDNLALATLEGIRGVELDLIRNALAILLCEPLAEAEQLSLVRGDDADLAL